MKCQTHYSIQNGDTLYQIAQDFYNSNPITNRLFFNVEQLMEAIQRSNNISDPNSISVNQNLDFTPIWHKALEEQDCNEIRNLVESHSICEDLVEDLGITKCNDLYGRIWRNMKELFQRVNQNTQISMLEKMSEEQLDNLIKDNDRNIETILELSARGDRMIGKLFNVNQFLETIHSKNLSQQWQRLDNNTLEQIWELMLARQHNGRAEDLYEHVGNAIKSTRNDIYDKLHHLLRHMYIKCLKEGKTEALKWFWEGAKNQKLAITSAQRSGTNQAQIMVDLGESGLRNNEYSDSYIVPLCDYWKDGSDPELKLRESSRQIDPIRWTFSEDENIRKQEVQAWLAEAMDADSNEPRYRSVITPSQHLTGTALDFGFKSNNGVRWDHIISLMEGLLGAEGVALSTYKSRSDHKHIGYYP